MRFKFAAAWRFLTICPLPFWKGSDESADLRDSAAYFPAVGLAAGIAIGLAMAVFAFLFPSSVAAALGVALLAAVSGGLHLDGLADSADALLSPGRSREKALEVMKDSRIGAHGAMGLFFLLLLKYACLASLPGTALPLALVSASVSGRAAMLFPMVLLPYARENGLGKAFDPAKKKRCLLYAIVWAGAAMLVFLGAGFIFGMVLWAAIAMAWVGYLKMRLNGATGDTYGAACEFGETALLLAAAFVFND